MGSSNRRNRSKSNLTRFPLKPRRVKMVQADQLDNLFMDLDDKALSVCRRFTSRTLTCRAELKRAQDTTTGISTMFLLVSLASIPTSRYSQYLANVMLAYYQRLFPFKKLFLWLNHDQTPSRQWTHREFAFTLQNDAYLRYNSFSTAEDLKKEVLRLNPSRFEIGPVYSARVSSLPCSVDYTA